MIKEKEKIECQESIKSRVIEEIARFDESLGSPPFDHPPTAAMEAVQTLSELFHAVALSKKISLFAEDEEVTYTFPVLCAAVPEGSSCVCKKLYRLLISCLTCIYPVVKYPLNGVISAAQDILSFEDVTLFVFLRETHSLTPDHLRKFLKIPEPAPKKKGRKAAKCQTDESEFRVPSCLLLEVLKSSLPVDLRRVMVESITTRSAFQRLCNGNKEVAVAMTECYPEVTKTLDVNDILSVLSPSMWTPLVELLEKQTDFTVLFDGKYSKIVRQVCSDVDLTDLTNFASSSLSKEKCLWGSFSAFLLLFGAVSDESSEKKFLALSLKLLRDTLQIMKSIIKISIAGKTNGVSGLDYLEVADKFFNWPYYLSLREQWREKNVLEAARQLRDAVLQDVKAVKQNIHADPTNTTAPGKGGKGGKKKHAPSTGAAKKGVPVPLMRSTFSEEKMQQFFRVTYALDELLELEAQNGSTLCVLGEILSVACSVCHYSLSSPTWLLFLNHVELFGKVASTISLKAEHTLFQYLLQATKCTSSVKWVFPFLVPSKECTRHWVKRWPCGLVVEILRSLARSNGHDERIPSCVVAGYLFCTIEEETMLRILSALHEADELMSVEKFVENSLREENGMAFSRFDECHSYATQLLAFIHRYMEERHQRDLQKKKSEMATQSDKIREKILVDTNMSKEDEAMRHEKAKRDALYQAQLEEIQCTLLERREAKKRKKDMLEKQREKQNRFAIALAAKTREQTEKERQEHRKRQLQQYKEASLQAFRASTFLHSLGIPTSQVMNILNGVVAKKPTVTPDDLLEFIITGTPQIPDDMLDDEEENDEASKQGGKDLNFWEEVLEHPADGSLEKGTSHSFHYRVKLFLDLFCYEGGDAFGNLPEIMPRISLKLSKRLLDPREVLETGFQSVDNAFLSMSRKKIVRIKNETAELTALGFRYHFPFHSPEGMLHVLIANQKEKVLSALLARRFDAAQPSSDLNDPTLEEEYEESDDSWDPTSEEEEESEGEEEEKTPEAVRFG